MCICVVGINQQMIGMKWSDVIEHLPNPSMCPTFFDKSLFWGYGSPYAPWCWDFWLQNLVMLKANVGQ